VSTGDTSSNGHKSRGAGQAARDIRDRPLFRIALLVAVLLVAFAVTKSCARQQNDVSQDEAVAIAREQIDFEPDRHQIRYLPQGVPPVYYWAVNFQQLNDNGNVVRTEVVLVNADTGEIAP
jgi:hypothetical protein